MKQTTNTNKITSILIGFVLLSGTMAFAIGPTQAFAGQERRGAVATEGPDISTTPAKEAALFSSDIIDMMCDITSLPNDGIADTVETLPSQGFPTDGVSYVILSTGDASIVVPATAAGVFANVANGNPVGLFPGDVQDGNGDFALDIATITMDCMIPNGVTTLTFDWGFGSEEAPEFTLGTFNPNPFSDYFRTVGALGNVLLTPGGSVVTSNTIDIPGAEEANPVTGTSGAPAPIFPLPDDTALNSYLCTASATIPCAQPQVGVWDVSGSQGGVITLGWEVGDDFDQFLDSAAYIDNLQTGQDVIKVCDGSEQICKLVVIEGTGDGVIEVNEHITYKITITIDNTSGNTWFGVTLKDRFAGDLAVGDVGETLNPISANTQPDVIDFADNLDCFTDVSLTQKGKTKKEFLDCPVSGDGNLSNGESASVGVTAETDYNPGQGKKTPGKRSYTSCGVHTINSGASIEFTLDDGTIVELQTPPVSVDVFELGFPDGDCDGDGVIDGDDECPFRGTEETGFVDEDGCPFTPRA